MSDTGLIRNVDTTGKTAGQTLPIVVLTGPTGAGKSSWAERVADEIPVEIISVDSAQVYRGLDIGTAKPTLATRARIPHHLIDIRDPAESYSAGQFVADVVNLIPAIRARGRIPLLVGGTMLYLRALFQGIAQLPAASEDVRRAIDRRAANEGWPVLHSELAHLDPQAAARINQNDPQRIQRALEVCYMTGRPISELQSHTHSALAEPVTLRWAVVPAERTVLHERIERRFHDMMSRGFLTEVERLHARSDLTSGHPAVRAVGYRQLWAYLDGKYDREEAVNRAVIATRQLAKRQLTWLRSDAGIRWVNPETAGAYERWNCDLRRELRQLGR